LIGTQLGGYTIESELGSGGMGTVYLARADVPVAVKVLHSHLLESPEALERFRREAEIGQRLRHPNVVRTLDVGSAVVDGTTHQYLVMEYVEGQTLRELLGELGTVPEELCRHVGREIAAGLEAIHALGVVHRDLKPANAIITSDQVVKVMDLGVAQLADAAMELSQTGVFLGSVLYAAPEQFQGKADARADLYSLGLMLFELATGRHPTREGSFADVLNARLELGKRPASDLNPQLSPFFDELVRMLLAPEPGERLGPAALLREALGEGERGSWWARQAAVIQQRTKRPLRRVRIPRETDLYGRDAELARLNALFAEAEAGHGQVVLLEGEAGIGKTRLVDEFVARLETDVNFLFGSYPPGGAATEAGAFSTAYREHFGARIDDVAEVMETAVLAPAFAALLRGEPTPRGEQPLSKDSLQTVFVQATRGLARERPTVLLIDDLHFAPTEGRALFAALAMAVPGHRILLIGTARHGLPQDWLASVERAPHAHRMELARLGPKDLARLLVGAFQSEQLAEELSFRIASKSDGNPFFVFEIIRGLREGHLIRRDDTGTWVTTQVIGEIEVPSSVVDLIHGRISSLSEEEREVLDVAACCGFEFDGALVAEGLGAERIPTLRRLAHIEKQHRLVHAIGRRFVFDHHQVQEALYEGLPEMLREEYHDALGSVLDEREDRELLEICHHFLRGGSPMRAKPYLTDALDQLERAYLDESALGLLARALQAPGVFTGVERAESLLRLAKLAHKLGRRDEEREALDEARALADQGDDLALKTRVRAGQAALLSITAQLEAAEAVAEEELVLALRIRNKELEAKAYDHLCHIAWSRGRHEDALGWADKGLEMYALLDDPRSEARLRSQRATVLEGLGTPAEVRLQHERALELSLRAGDREGIGIATGNLGNWLANAGFLADGIENFVRCVETFSEIGARRPLAVGLVNTGQAWFFLGDMARAREYCERTLALAREIEFPQAVAFARLTLGRVCGAEGDRDKADNLMRDAQERYRAIQAPAHVADALLEAAELLGWSEETRPLLEEALAIGEKHLYTAPRALARAGLALLPGGDAEAAVAEFDAYRTTLRLRMKLHVLFLLWKATGERSYLDESRRLLDHLRAHAPEDRREPMIANVPLHRAVWDASE
jgi:tetratricopeptide (TPR) repeat protein